MTKSAWIFAVFATIVIVFFASIAHLEVVMANPDYSIDRVDHTIRILSNGFVIVNDTITTSAPVSGSFFIGFPYKYGVQLLHCVAYEASNRSSVFSVTLNVPLENHVGFYGVRVDMLDNATEAFTVEFILSNSLVTQDSQNSTVFTVDFPGYPSLTESATLCNGLVSLPSGAEYIKGTVAAFNYTTSDLTAFSYAPSTITFGLGNNMIQLFEIKQLNRQVSINAFGDIQIGDTYYVTNKAPSSAESVDIILPSNSTTPIAEDQFGRSANITLVDNLSIRYRVNLIPPAEPDKSSRFIIIYNLDKNAYSKPRDEANNSVYAITQFKEITYYIDEVSVILSIPEGARLLSSPTFGFYGVDKTVFTDTVTIQKQNFVSLDNFVMEINYEYNLLWTAFRPTLWVWSIALVGSAIFIVSRRHGAPETVALPSGVTRLRPENLKTFVDLYEEKMKILSEIDNLEAKVQKGRIPRRRYKVQKKTFEMRLTTLDRNLSELKEGMRASSSLYADLMRQLEVAETEINDAEANIENIEARQNRGEITMELYRSRVEEYGRRKEKAETTINGILLRLREETR